MLSGEGNENGEKTTICLIGKKATLHVQHTFFVHFSCRCFARLQRETFRNSLLVLRFLLFLMLHEDRFCGFVLVTRWLHMRNTYIEESCFFAWRYYYCFSVNQHGERVRCVSFDPKTRGEPSRLSVNSFQVRIFLTLAVCHSCCHIVRSSFAHTFRLTEKQRYRPSHSKCCIVAQLCLNIQIA